MMRRATMLAMLLGLSACGNEAAEAPPADEQSGARGEVLGGTISDEMIPLDTIPSERPANPPDEETTGQDDETAAEQ